MSDKPIRVGSRVMLKSGGPTMTVIRVHRGVGESDDEVTCVWMSGYGSIDASEFPLACVQRDRRND